MIKKENLYTLVAFAKKVGISPSRLSDILVCRYKTGKNFEKSFPGSRIVEINGGKIVEITKPILYEKRG